MDSGHIALIILTGILLLIAYRGLRLIRVLNRRYYRNMLRGNLREDYARKHPNLAQGHKVACRCRCERISIRNLGGTRLEGSDIIREHVCQNCGYRLYFSVSGSYLEGIAEELKKEAGN